MLRQHRQGIALLRTGQFAPPGKARLASGGRGRLHPDASRYGSGWQTYKRALPCWQGPGALLFVHQVLVAFGIQQVGEFTRVVQLDAEQPASAVGV